MGDQSHVLEITEGPKNGEESLVGFLSRVGTECEWGSLYQVVQLAGLDTPESVWAPSEPDLGRLSEFLGIPVEDLAGLSWNAPGATAFFTPWLNRTRPRICPLCLREEGILRREWELLPVTECPIHRVALIDSCQCDTPISPARQRIDYCFSCGESLGDDPSTTSTPTTLSLSLWLGQLALEERWGTAGSAASGPLQNIGFAAACDLVNYISGLALRLQQRPDHRPRVDVASCRQTLVDAAAVINSAWPSGFVDLIRQFEVRADRADADGMSKAFPHLCRSLYSGKETPWRNQLRDVFESYVRAARPGLLLTLSSRDRMYGRMGLAKEFSTITAVAKEAGATTSAVLRAIDDLEIKPINVQQGNGKTCLRISREQVCRINDAVNGRPDLYLVTGPAAQRNSQQARRRFLLETGSDMDTAYRWFKSGRDFPSERILDKWPSRSIVGVVHIAERLDTSAPTATKLRDAGLFNDQHATRGEMDAVLIEHYAAFEGRLAQLSAGARGGKASGRPLMTALHDQLKRYNVDLCELLALVMRQMIAIVGINRRQRGLSRLLVSAADVTKLIDEREAQRSRGGLSISEATQRLGFADPNIVIALTKVGLLMPVLNPRTRTGRRLFSEEEVASFRQAYISLREIARRRLFGRFSAAGAVAGWLGQRGIKPVCGPHINGVPAIFFHRRDVEGLSWFGTYRSYSD